MFMSGRNALVALCFGVQILASSYLHAIDVEALPPKIRENAHNIEQWGKDPALIKDVSAQNAKAISADEIKKIDQEWIASKTENEKMKTLLNNSCALRLHELSKEIDGVVEAMVMDNQGALVCMTRRTSDYWQGDEPKWQQSYLGGKGALFVEKAEYDESTRAIVIHISVPVMQEQKAIGALTVGVKRPQGLEH